MKRVFDCIIAAFLLLILLLPMALIALLVFSTSKGPVIYWSKRVGKNNKIFNMPKFRSMKVNTPSISSDLLDNPKQFLSPIGGIIRKTSIDELPQILSVIQGNMSFVGPRPALFNQADLIALRKSYGIDSLVPGITGWAQINGRDNLNIYDKVQLELEYKKNQSFWFDIKIIGITILKVFSSNEVSH